MGPGITTGSIIVITPHTTLGDETTIGEAPIIGAMNIEGGIIRNIITQNTVTTVTLGITIDFF